MSDLDPFSPSSQYHRAIEHFHTAHEESDISKKCVECLLGIVKCIPVAGAVVDFVSRKISCRTLDSRIEIRKHDIAKELQDPSHIIQRIFFERMGSKTTTSDKLDEKFGYSSPDVQFINTLAKLEHSASEHPEWAPKLTPLIENLRKSQDCFVGLGALLLEPNAKTRARLQEQLAQKMASCLANMPNDSSCLLPGGFASGDIFDPGLGKTPFQGHAIAMEFRKDSKSNVTLLLYNTDTEKHQQDPTSISLYPRVYGPGQIGEKQAKDSFLRLLTECFMPPSGKVTETTFYNILDSSSNTLKRSKELETAERPYKPQGNISRCAYTSISRYIHNTLEKIDPKLHQSYKLSSATKLDKEFEAFVEKNKDRSVTFTHPLVRIGAAKGMSVLQKIKYGMAAGIFGPRVSFKVSREQLAKFKVKAAKITTAPTYIKDNINEYLRNYFKHIPKLTG